MLIPLKPVYDLNLHIFNESSGVFLDRLIDKIRFSSIDNSDRIIKLSDSDLLVPVLSELDQLINKSIELCHKETVSQKLDFSICYFNFPDLNKNEIYRKNITGQLSNLIKEYKCHLLMDFNHFAHLANPNSFNYRFIGSFKLEDAEESLALFDFFDSDNDEIKRLKLETKSAFEDSVFNFYSSRIPQSIAGFKNILKLFPQDQASMVYVSRCEKLLEKNQI